MKRYGILVSMVAICIAVVSEPVSATILTLQYGDMQGNVYNCSTWTLNNGYGNNATAALVPAGFAIGGNQDYWFYQQGQSGWTPDVTVAYSPTDAGNGKYMYGAGYGGSLPVALLIVDTTASTYSSDTLFTFTAAGGKQADIYGFSVASTKTFNDVPYTVVDGGNNVLVSSTFSVSPGQIVDLSINPAIAKASTVKLVIGTTGFEQYLYVGNIEFGEVPEPATMSLLGLGMLLFRKLKR